MKRILSLLFAAMLLLSVAGCTSKAPNEPTAPSGDAVSAPDTTAPDTTVPDTTVPEAGTDGTDAPEGAQPDDAATAEKAAVRLAGMTGPTAMGMAKLLSDNEAGEAANNYEFTLAGAADEIVPLLAKGELDIAAVPVNLASVLYNNTNGAVQLLAINTLGVLYIVDNGDGIQSLSDLAGKTIYATGKGSTPEYTLRYLLSRNGIDPDTDVTIEFKSEPAEIVAMMTPGGDEVVAMLPQPYVTVAQGQVEGLRVALDLTEEWNKLEGDSDLFTGCLVVRRAFAEENPEAVEAFLAEYSASTDWVNANVDDAAELIEHFGIFKAAVAKKALPYCNITFIAGLDLKLAENYLQILFDQNPKAVGGAMPGAAFYYGN